MGNQRFVPVCSRVLGHCSTSGDRVALICGDETVSWHELGQRIRTVSRCLTAREVSKGDAVLLLGDNSIDYVVAVLGVAHFGGVVVPVSTVLSEGAMARMLADSGAAALVAIGDAERIVEQNSAFSGVSWFRYGTGDPKWHSLIGERGSGMDGAAARDASDTFDRLYSSGTTGDPKGINHTELSRTVSGRQMGVMCYTPESIVLVVTPLYSNLTLGALLNALMAGSQVVLMSKFSAGHFLATVEELGVSHVSMVPVQYQRVMRSEEFEYFDLSSLVEKLSAGSPMSASLKLEVARRWPGAFYDVYGQTEGGASTILNVGLNPEKAHTVGMPMPDCDIRIVGEDGRELGVGESGEVVGRFATVTRDGAGQWGESEDVAGGWDSSEGERFVRSGDIGYLDEDGFLVLQDRKNDLIISGGVNIFASDIESVFEGHPDVEEVVAFGVPSELWGETPVVAVVWTARDGANSEESLLAWGNSRVDRYSRVSAVMSAAELPRNGLGKVLKRSIRSRFLRQSAASIHGGDD